MEELEDRIANYTSTDETAVLAACKWYHNHIGYTYDDGSCYNVAGYVDEDCDKYLEYQAKLEVLSHVVPSLF